MRQCVAQKNRVISPGPLKNVRPTALRGRCLNYFPSFHSLSVKVSKMRKDFFRLPPSICRKLSFSLSHLRPHVQERFGGGGEVPQHLHLPRVRHLHRGLLQDLVRGKKKTCYAFGVERSFANFSLMCGQLFRITTTTW